jgi:transposase
MEQGKECMHNNLQYNMLEGEMVHQDKYGAIVELFGRGVPKKAIARALDVDIKTVRKYLKLKQWVPYRRKAAATTVLSGFEDWLKARAPEVNFNARVLFRELKLKGYHGAYDAVKRYIRPFRSEHRRDALATLRFETSPGRQGQVDWGSSWVWMGERRVRVHFFVLILGYSRRLYAQAFPDEKLPDEKLSSLIAGHEAAFAWFGGCPRELLYDNPRTIVKGRECGQVVLNGTFADFSAHYGFTPRFCRPYRARTKGKVESGIRYLKQSFLPGRRFRDMDHLNSELGRWLVEVADVRIHGTTGERPIDRFRVESSALLDVKAVPPYRLETVVTRQVALDAMVSFEGNRYSVPWRYAGELVEVRVRDGGLAFICRGQVIARHPRLSGTNGKRVDPSHYKGLFRGFGERKVHEPPAHDPRWTGEEVMVRDLAVYDRVAGL